MLHGEKGESQTKESVPASSRVLRLPSGTVLILSLLAPCNNLPFRQRIGVPLGTLVLLVFVGVGIDMVVHPRRHMNSYLKRGGEMLQNLNEMGVQFSGLVFSCAACWLLYELVRSVWDSCFG